ncbi:MAG: hypothetical protein IJV85_00600 [Clostridia bacterium]|nr:hypothetical protein [Clostridia bacterium]
MTRVFALIIPTIFIISFLFASARKVKVYESFTQGVKGAIPLVLSVFPYIATVTMATKIFEVSGLDEQLSNLLSPLFKWVGVPTEIAPLLFMKPLSGGGSIAVLSDILERYGVDSYIARCACVAYGASDTIFYISAVYFAGLKRKKLTSALVISLVSYLLSVVLCCFLCRFL